MSVHFDISKKGITLNGALMAQIQPETFVEILGEPRKSHFTGTSDDKSFSRELWIWDEHGFYLEIPQDGRFPYPVFRLNEDLELQQTAKFNYFDLNPKQLFGGTITVNKKPLLSALSDTQLKKAYIFLEKKIGDWRLNFRLKDDLQQQIKKLSWSGEEAEQKIQLIRQAAQPFDDFYFTYEPPAPPKVSSGKYLLRAANEQDLQFADLNFKLAIVQELMYVQEVLTPKFDVFDFCQDYDQRNIDPEKYQNKAIPEVKQWFANLPIPAELGEKIVNLDFDGGNDIYAQIIPFWDGEDNFYTIKSISEQELAQFPNLKSITGPAILMSKKVKMFLQDKGITIEE